MYLTLHHITSRNSMTEKKTHPSAKDRIFESAANLFADKGFDSVSIREICKTAGTSANMVHHYFGSKDGLFDAIVNSFTDNVFAVPLRILEKEISSKIDFTNRFSLFFEESLIALIENRTLLHVVNRHEIHSKAMINLNKKFVSFLHSSQQKGYIQNGLEPELISGFLIERLSTQILYAQQISSTYNQDIIGDLEYRSKWTRSNLSLFLHGLVDKTI